MAPGEELTSQLEELRLVRPVVSLGPQVMRELPSQVRVLSSGQVRFDYSWSFRKNADPEPPVVLYKETAKPDLDFEAYDHYPVGYGFIRNRKRSFLLNGRSGFRPMGLLCALTGRMAAFHEDRSRRYWLAVRRSSRPTGREGPIAGPTGGDSDEDVGKPSVTIP